MTAQQEAVDYYRSNLAPVIFVIAQKVYAELFRIVIWNMKEEVGWKQEHVRTKIDNLMRAHGSSLVVSPPLSNYGEFQDWWQRSYNFADFQKARNKIMHLPDSRKTAGLAALYTFDGTNLVVHDELVTTY